MVEDQIVKYLWLVAGWAIYFSLHSLMASQKAKRLSSKMGFSPQAHRIAYNIISGLGLLALLFLNGTIKSDLLFDKSRLTQIIALFVAAAGVLIINAAFKQYNFKSFAGLEKEEAKFNTKGILGYVRHPIYLGTILLVIGFVVYDPRLASLVSAICILCYIPIGIYFEENKLIKEYGGEYRKYKNSVPAVFPDLASLFKKIT